MIERNDRKAGLEIVRLSKRYLLLAAVLGGAVAVLPTIASSETTPTVEAINEPAAGGYNGESHHWAPAQVSVGAGGTVSLQNQGEVPHGVEWVKDPATPSCSSGIPVGTSAAASRAKWNGTCTFTQPGTYTFYCTVHGAEMTGTITVSAAGTTTNTTQTSSPPTTTPTTTATETPSGSPLTGAPSLPSTQHGSSVKGTLDISKSGAGDRLEVELLATTASLAKAKHPTRVKVGRFVRSSASAGKQSFSVKLNSKARRALKHHHRLALIVKITLTPSYGEPLRITKSVTQRP